MMSEGPVNGFVRKSALELSRKLLPMYMPIFSSSIRTEIVRIICMQNGLQMCTKVVLDFVACLCQ
jgi:hypothetical protein